MKKVTIIGAGNVGATAAMNIARMGICDVVLLDIKEGYAEGKAMDIMQTLAVEGVNSNVVGVTNDYSATEDSDVVVITSGIPRKPGMTREELVGVNSGVVKSVMDGITKYNYKETCPIYVVVSNPMDTMCMVVLKYLQDKYPASANTFQDQIIGMGGLLDSNRFKYFIKKAIENDPSIETTGMDKVAITDINAYVVGGHGDTTMIPVIEHATWNGIKITDFLLPDVVDGIIEDTMKGGATLTKLLGTSAWEAPAAGIAKTVKAILLNEHCVIPSSTWSNAYGCYIGQLAEIGEDGVANLYWGYEKFPRVQKKLLESAEAIRKVNENI